MGYCADFTQSWLKGMTVRRVSQKLESSDIPEVQIVFLLITVVHVQFL